MFDFYLQWICLPCWNVAQLLSRGIFEIFAGLLYTAGSLGFISVDIIDFQTYTGSNFNRSSIIFSMIGNTLYTIGSVAFVPKIFYMGGFVGVWSFIVGGAFIVLSQL